MWDVFLRPFVQALVKRQQNSEVCTGPRGIWHEIARVEAGRDAIALQPKVGKVGDGTRWRGHRVRVAEEDKSPGDVD